MISRKTLQITPGSGALIDCTQDIVRVQPPTPVPGPDDSLWPGSCLAYPSTQRTSLSVRELTFSDSKRARSLTSCHSFDSEETRQVLGRVLDHSDDIAEDKLSTSFAETEAAWMVRAIPSQSSTSHKQASDRLAPDGTFSC